MRMALSSTASMRRLAACTRVLEALTKMPLPPAIGGPPASKISPWWVRLAIWPSVPFASIQTPYWQKSV